jgi:hypothetical protein
MSPVREWETVRRQFKRLANIFLSIEKQVLADGRVQASTLDVIVKNNKLSPLGERVLADFLIQSDAIQVEDNGQEVWLVRNPDYLVEEEDTLTREIPIAPDQA